MHDWNMGQAERRGYAISLEVIGLKAETLLEAIHKIINDQKYLVNE
jgi:UDP:flavonoid glycosyltransferase YjiC (YdhE family)